MDKTWKPNLRKHIALKVRELRKRRNFTQAELAARLGVSQARLSVIEQGNGSFSAEQFLEILRIFNVPAHSFAITKRDPQGDIQNALARNGATHLMEDSDLLPSEHLDEVEALIREVLVDARNPRQIAALGPVLVKNLGQVNLNGLWAKFIDYGLQARLGWTLENTAEAIRMITPTLKPKSATIPLRKAETTITNFLSRKGVSLMTNPAGGPHAEDLDIIDGRALSLRTIHAIWDEASEASRHWGIVSALKPEDFAEAIRASTLDTTWRHYHDSIR